MRAPSVVVLLLTSDSKSSCQPVTAVTHRLIGGELCDSWELGREGDGEREVDREREREIEEAI